MKERIIKNWQSSLMGLVLLIVATVALFTQDKVGLSEYLIFIPFCLGLIYVKDSIFKV